MEGAGESGHRHGDDGPVDMVALVDQMNNEEDEATALMGGQDNDACTFDNPEFVARQTVFACLSCLQETGQRAGVCLGCSDTCHKGHDIVELYTKRNFKCDCGTPRCSSVPCRLRPKDEDNPSNVYNHNFDGGFCHCRRPYPDETLPEDVEETMAQCQLCEDWFHMEEIDDAHHNFTDLVEEPDLSFICGSCHEQHPWLVKRLHVVRASSPASTKPSAAAPSHDEGGKEARGDSEHPAKRSRVTPHAEVADVKDEGNSEFRICFCGHAESDQQSSRSSRVQQPQDGPEQGQAKEQQAKHGQASKGEESQASKLQQQGEEGSQLQRHGAFYRDFRNVLCRCKACKALFEKRGASFLHREDDSVEHFEETRRHREEERLQQLAQNTQRFLARQPHTTQINFARMPQEFGDVVRAGLRQLLEKGHTEVTEEDIRSMTSDFNTARQ